MSKLQKSSSIRPFCDSITNYFKQYCESTSIHGFRYFGEKRPLFERIWWVVIFILCLSGCSYMIYKIYDKYDTTPVIVTFSTRDTPIYSIPFPAVTICPETKSEKTIFNYNDIAGKLVNNETLTPLEQKHFQYINTLCDNLTNLIDPEAEDPEYQNNTDIIQFKKYVDAVKSEMQFQLTYNASDFIEFLENATRNFHPILYCRFGINHDPYACWDDFIPVITDEGICYSFNVLDRDQIFTDSVYQYRNFHKVKPSNKFWDIETGYAKDAGIETYPKRALSAGVENGLQILLSTRNMDVDFMCKHIQGFKVALHLPFRIPIMKQEYFRVPLDQAVLAAVHPSVITTSAKVKTFSVEKRMCYFSTEKKLKYFHFYSQQNCKVECTANYFLENFNCTTINMPRSNNTEICGPALNSFGRIINGINQYADVFTALEGDELKKFSCDCLPLCTDINYNTETTQVIWDWQETFRAVKLNHINRNVTHLSKLTVYFKNNYFMAAERQELYGPTDFVANFGGLLGLFTGFSMLSLMEIIYFLTVRICCNSRMYGRWTGDLLSDK